MLSASQFKTSCRPGDMALLATCLTDIQINQENESNGFENFLTELFKGQKLAPFGELKACDNMNTVEDSDSEMTEQNLNALMSSSDSDENWSMYESDQENNPIKGDWDVSDDILVSLNEFVGIDVACFNDIDKKGQSSTAVRRL